MEKCLTVKLLLQSGGTDLVKVQEENGRTTIYVASQFGNLGAMKAMLET